MKIAVTYDQGEVFQHFGHTERFKLYEVENGGVVSARVIDTDGSGHGALATMLVALGADTLICGGLGEGARQALKRAGIEVRAGVRGGADAAVAALLAGDLASTDAATCDHHHDDGHVCGGHDCGEHDCGGCH